MYKIKCLILCIVISFIIPLPAFADTDDYVDWDWGGEEDGLKIQRFSSADDFSSNVHAVRYDWNSIDNDVMFKEYLFRADDINYYYQIRVYGVELTGTTLASCGIYDTILGVDIAKNFWTFTGTVDVAKIKLDTRSSGSLLDKTDAQQQKTVTHEIGHALALDHPDCASTAIMQQGYSSPAALSIQSHDENNLSSKW